MYFRSGALAKGILKRATEALRKRTHWISCDKPIFRDRYHRVALTSHA
jgi:hypothetical protein